MVGVPGVHQAKSLTPPACAVSAQAVMLNVVDDLQQQKGNGRLQCKKRYHFYSCLRRQVKGWKHKKHQGCGRTPGQRAAQPVAFELGDTLRLQLPAADQATPQAARQKPVEALAEARRSRVVLRGGARVVAPVVLDHEVAITNAAHQYPGAKAIQLRFAVAQLVRKGDALRAGDKAHTEGHAQHRRPVSLNGGIAAQRNQRQLQQHVQPKHALKIGQAAVRTHRCRRGLAARRKCVEQRNAAPHGQGPQGGLCGCRNNAEHRQQRQQPRQQKTEIGKTHGGYFLMLGGVWQVFPVPCRALR